MFGKIQLEGVDYLFKSDLSNFDKALLLALVGLAKYNGLVYATQREISKYAQADVSTINKSLKRLQKTGLIKKTNGYLRIDPMFCHFGRGHVIDIQDYLNTEEMS